MRLFTQKRRWLLSVGLAAAFSALVLTGCGGGENPANGGGGTLGASLSYGGQTYKTVAIGGKTWMAENLNYAAPSGSWCYDDDNSNCTKYGRLYDWETAMTVCPSDWHLPSRVEWRELAIAAGGTGIDGDEGTAGTNLKSKTGWNSYPEVPNGTDEYGFSALPGGYRYPDGRFNNVGNNGNYWTATENGRGDAYYRRIYYDREFVIEDEDDGKERGYSVRCVRD